MMDIQRREPWRSRWRCNIRRDLLRFSFGPLLAGSTWWVAGLDIMMADWACVWRTSTVALATLNGLFTYEPAGHSWCLFPPPWAWIRHSTEL